MTDQDQVTDDAAAAFVQSRQEDLEGREKRLKIKWCLIGAIILLTTSCIAACCLWFLFGSVMTGGWAITDLKPFLFP